MPCPRRCDQTVQGNSSCLSSRNLQHPQPHVRMEVQEEPRIPVEPSRLWTEVYSQAAVNGCPYKEVETVTVCSVSSYPHPATYSLCIQIKLTELAHSFESVCTSTGRRALFIQQDVTGIGISLTSTLRYVTLRYVTQCIV
jgi:hypothetical protein